MVVYQGFLFIANQLIFFFFIIQRFIMMLRYIDDFILCFQVRLSVVAIEFEEASPEAMIYNFLVLKKQRPLYRLLVLSWLL